MKTGRMLILFLLLTGIYMCHSCSSEKHKNRETIGVLSKPDSVLIHSIFLLVGQDSLLLKNVTPHIYHIQKNYVFTLTQHEAERIGVAPFYYEKIQGEINRYNETINK